MKKIGRNEKCNCGSGMKYKKCCMKKQTPVLSLIGFYYKSKDDDGFGISVSDLNPEIFEFFVDVFNLIQMEWERQKTEMESGKFYGLYKELLEKTIDFERNSLNEEISNWYKLNGFTNGIQPLGNTYVNWEISPRTQPTLIKILRSIYILTEVGEIKNDNYNGLNFMYSQGEKLKKVS